MKELLEVIAKRLVEHPEQVVVATEGCSRGYGEGHRQAGQNCKGNPHCGKSRRHP